MDYQVSDSVVALCAKAAAFIEERVIPLEQNPDNYNEYENLKMSVRDEMRAEARDAGIWAPQISKERGGMGLTMLEQSALYEVANRSIFGPCIFNCAAPDDGNMRVLERIATEDQKDRWLDPIVAGKVNSSFVMTEPHPGGGSDPGMIQTSAEKIGNKWKIHGEKWFISAADVSDHFILMVRTDQNQDEKRRHLSAFMFHRDQPGWRIVRRIENMGPDEHGGVCELEFDGLEIDDSDRLMEVGDGLRITQTRLGPARLTHCMRWLGLSKRCMEIAAEYTSRREGFGIRLADRESVQLKMGELAHDIAVGRHLTAHAAWKLDQGDYARKEVSMAKIHVADTLHKAADTAIQLNGARGYSKDTLAQWIYRYARCARIVDGASEVHKMVLARFYAKEGDDFWNWGV